MTKNLLSGPILACLVIIWAPKFFYMGFAYTRCQICRKLSSYSISRKTYDPTQEKCEKPDFEPDLAPLAQIRAGPSKFFFFNLASSVTRYHGQLSSCTISEKTNDPILRKLSDGQTDRQTDGRTDESDFIGRCLTNVEHLKKELCKNSFESIPN